MSSPGRTGQDLAVTISSCRPLSLDAPSEGLDGVLAQFGARNVAGSLLHRTFVVMLVLAVLDDGGDSLEGEHAVAVLDHVLQIEILDREVVVAVLVRAAHRRVSRLA